MSRNELLFEEFLKSHNVNYVIPEKGNFCITNVAFNKNGIYKPDFYLSDRNLYIEIKGFMTIYVVNKLHYLLQLLPANFCILQMTEADWIRELLFDKSISSMAARLQRSCEIQFNEILQLPNKQLHDLSYKRLTEYIVQYIVCINTCRRSHIISYKPS